MALTPIGSVITPANFQAVSAQGKVLLSWTSVPLATAYYISRSTDNVTFAALGNTTSLSYSDTTGTAGTVYYYYLQAYNGAVYSPVTATVDGIKLNVGQTTVGNLKLECQQRTDRVYSNNISDQEWNSMISQSYKELWDILAQKFGDDYFVATPYTFTLTGGTQLYPLPSDFKALLGAEVALNPSDPNSWITIKQFEFIQRNLLNFPNIYTFYGITNIRYRLNGNNIYIAPIPTGGQTLRIWYVPRPNQLIADTDIVDGVAGWEEYIVTDVAIKALAKTEEDVSVFAMQKAALLKRVEEAAENRNIGEPQRVSDARRVNFSWGDGSFGGWGMGGMS